MSSNGEYIKPIYIGIVVVSYHNPQMTARFVHEELSKLTTSYELVIVNNDSTEQECEELSRLCGIPITQIICSKENLGYAKGNNIGVNFLKSKGVFTHYLFTNDDIEIKDANILDVLCSTMDEHPDLACIGPRVIGLDGCGQSPHEIYISPLRKIGWRLFPFFRRKYVTKNADYTNNINSRYCYWVVGAFMLVNASDFDNIGGFDPRTFLYYEEVILSERFDKVGKKVFFEPSVSVVHYEGNSTKSTPSKAKMQIEKNSSLLYYKEYKHVPRVILWLYDLICKK